MAMWFEEVQKQERGTCGYEFDCQEGFGQTLDPPMTHKCGRPTNHKGDHAAWVRTDGHRHRETVER